MSITQAYMEKFAITLLDLNKSIRWIGIASSLGELLLVKRRKDLIPLMTLEENQEYTLNAIGRHKSRLKFQEKIGKLLYALGKYEKLTRVIIPINDYYYLMLTIDIEELNFDLIITDSVIPFVGTEKVHFTY